MRERKRKRRKTIAILSILLAAILIGNGLVSYLGEKISTIGNQIMEAEYGKLEGTIETKAIIVKNEETILAPIEGTINFLVAGGERVAVGQTVAKIVGGFDSQFQERKLKEIKTDKAGIVSFNIDGWESLLELDLLDELHYQAIYSEIGKNDSVLQVNNGKDVKKGEPLLKIVNNLSPIKILMEAPLSNSRDLIAGETYLIKLDDEESIKGNLVDIQNSNGSNQLLFSMSSYPDKLLLGRTHQVKILMELFEGIIVEERSIFYQENEPGLLVIQESGQAEWQPITINGKLENQAAIEGVAEGSLYIANPR